MKPLIGLIQIIRKTSSKETGKEARFRSMAKKVGLSVDKVQNVIDYKEPVSLETPVGDEDDGRFGDFIEDNRY